MFVEACQMVHSVYSIFHYQILRPEAPQALVIIRPILKYN